MDFVIKKAGAEQAADLETLEAVLKTRPEPDFVARLLASGRDVWVAYQGGNPAGYVVLNPTPAYSLFARLEIPELQDLNVLPAARGQGIGAALVTACEDGARARGAKQVGLAVGLTKSYGPAQRLYVRLGYMPDGYGITYDRENVTPGDMRPVDDNLCLMMIKDL